MIRPFGWLWSAAPKEPPPTVLDLELLVQDVDLHGLPLDAINGHSFRRLWGIHALQEGIQVIRLKADRDFIAFDDREIKGLWTVSRRKRSPWGRIGYEAHGLTSTSARCSTRTRSGACRGWACSSCRPARLPAFSYAEPPRVYRRAPDWSAATSA